MRNTEPTMAQVMAHSEQPAGHPGHRRHQAHPALPRLWLVIAVGVAVSALLLLLLAVTQAPAAAHLAPPTGSMGSEVQSATAGMSNDLGQLDGSDLSGHDLNEAGLMSQ